MRYKTSVLRCCQIETRTQISIWPQLHHNLKRRSNQSVHLFDSPRTKRRISRFLESPIDLRLRCSRGVMRSLAEPFGLEPKQDLRPYSEFSKLLPYRLGLWLHKNTLAYSEGRCYHSSLTPICSRISTRLDLPMFPQEAG